MAVAESWEEEEKSGMPGSRTRMSHFKPGKSTRSIFKDLSEFGLCRRTARKVHAHLQPSLAMETPPSHLRDSALYTKNW